MGDTVVEMPSTTGVESKVRAKYRKVHVNLRLNVKQSSIIYYVCVRFAPIISPFSGCFNIASLKALLCARIHQKSDLIVGL